MLKNALDWASRPFPGNVLRDKPAAVVGASTGLFGAVWAQAETRKVLKYAGAQVLEAELAVGMADGAFDEDGASPTRSCARDWASCSTSSARRRPPRQGRRRDGRRGRPPARRPAGRAA